jgi:hypothetical protein
MKSSRTLKFYFEDADLSDWLIYSSVSVNFYQTIGRGTRLLSIPHHRVGKTSIEDGLSTFPSTQRSNSALGIERVRVPSRSVTEIMDDLRNLCANYARTKDKAILAYVKSFIRSLKKSKINKLKRLFLSTQFGKTKLHSLSFIDRRKRIRSLIFFGTTLYTSVTGCEENSYFAIPRGNEYYFQIIKNVVYVQQRRAG